MGLRLAIPSAVVVLHLLVTVVHAQPLSETPRQDFWVTDGPVLAMVATNDTLYIGGEFTYVGPPTGHGVPVDLATGKVLETYPRVNGTVETVAPDGTGGWFIGGEFSKVGGRPRQNLAHILASGEVDAQWIADANWIVRDLVVSHGRVFVAGIFTTINGTARNSLAALDAATGNVLDWNPNPDGEVRGLALLDGTLYFGGNFTHVGGVERITLAAVDAETGELDAWPNHSNFLFPPTGFRAIGASNGRVFVSADFPGAFEAYRDFVALNAVTGASVWFHSTWLGQGAWDATSVKATAGHLLVSRNGIMSLDPATGQMLWKHGSIGSIDAIEIIGEMVVVGGYPVKLWPSETEREVLAKLDLGTGDILDWNPLANGSVMSLAASGSILYVGGLFGSYGGVERKGLAAIDIPSGRPVDYELPVTGYSISALALHERNLLIAGSLTVTATQEGRGLASMDIHTRELSSWAPARYGGSVRTMVADGTTIYLGGEFTSMNGIPRASLAAVDLVTGATLPWQADANGPIYKLAKAGGLLVAGGAFTEIGAQPRSRLAALDLDTGAPADWNPAPSSNVTGLAVSGSTVYFAGPFDSVGGEPRLSLAAADLEASLLSWAPTTISTNMDGYATSSPLLIRGESVFFGHRGNFAYYPNQPNGLHEFDQSDGVASGWSPIIWNTAALATDASGRLFAGGQIFDLERFGWIAGVLAFDQPGFSRLETMSISNGDLRLKLHGDEGATYELDQSTLDDDWSLLGERVILGGSATIEVPVAPGDGQFFRARLKE